MGKAFIFDMDGVIINTEQVWATEENNFLEKLVGKEIAKKMGDNIGITVSTMYEKARSFGYTKTKDEFQREFTKKAFTVYDRANITPGTDELANMLIKLGYKIGIVSSSSRSWIDRAIKRLSFKDEIASIISLNDRPDLKPKPSPEGYLETMKNLGSTAKTTIILEDSNFGIQAAKASGAFTIAFSANLVKGYVQQEADAKANSMTEVTKIVKDLDSHIS